MARKGASSMGDRLLRIGYVSCGSFIHVRPYVEFFKQRGHDVRFLAYDRPIPELGVPTYDISYGARGSSALSAKWRYLLAGSVGARAVLHGWRPDILHGHYATSAGVICLLSGFRPYVLTAHGSDVLGGVRSATWRRILRLVLGHSVLVNSVSDEIASCVTGLGIPVSRQLVATPGVDCEGLKFRPRDMLHDPVRLLCTRTLADAYDPATILEACRLLRNEGVRFEMTFAAAGALERELKAMSAREGLTGQVRFLGGYTQADLPRLLYDHDLYLSASRSDGTSISLLEAMAAGLFPIVSRIPGHWGWVEENRTALAFDSGCAAELAQRIREAVATPELRRSGVRRNRGTVERRAARTDQMMRLERAYQAIAGG